MQVLNGNCAVFIHRWKPVDYVVHKTGKVSIHKDRGKLPIIRPEQMPFSQWVCHLHSAEADEKAEYRACVTLRISCEKGTPLHSTQRLLQGRYLSWAPPRKAKSRFWYAHSTAQWQVSITLQGLTLVLVLKIHTQRQVLFLHKLNFPSSSHPLRMALQGF